MNRIRFLDLPRLHESIRGDLVSAYHSTVKTGSFVGGQSVDDFESAFAQLHGVKGSATCGSGTDALALALRAVGVTSGDEVIIPSMTFVATAEAVIHANAIPVIADVDDQTLLLSESAVGAAITAKTRAIVPVHLFGHVVPFDSLRLWKSAGLHVIEDAAQAHAASCIAKSVGTVGDAACFSFYPGKNLGALGDGGAVLSDDEDLLSRVRLLRDHGRQLKYEHEEIGWCSRLDGLQAAFLLAKLKYLPTWTASRAALADRYRVQLESVDGVRLVPWSPGAVHHLFVVRVPASLRSEVRQRLSSRGISTGLHYPIPLSQQPSLAPWRRKCNIAEQAAGEVLSLPIDPLMAMREVDQVCEELSEALQASSGSHP